MGFINKIVINGVSYDLCLYSKAILPFKTWGPYVQVSDEYPINSNKNACFYTDNYNQLTLSLSFYIEPGISIGDNNVLLTMEKGIKPYPSKMIFSDITGKNHIIVYSTDGETVYFDNITPGDYNTTTRNKYVIHFIIFRAEYL